MLHRLNLTEIALYTNPVRAEMMDIDDDNEMMDIATEKPYIQKAFCCFHITNLPRVSASRKMIFEAGGKIIMPEEALLSLVHHDFSGEPLLFRLTHKDRSTHCGVLEFTAKEDSIVMPCWMMENLQVKDGNMVTVEPIELPKATSVKLKISSEEFLQRYDPKPTLEARFVHFTCLTEGDKLKVNINGGVHEMTVIQTRPDSAVCIVNCDLNVEFELPSHFDKGSNMGSRLNTQIGTGRRLDGEQLAEGEADSHMEIDSGAEDKGRGGSPDLAFSPGKIIFNREFDANNKIEQDENIVKGWSPFCGEPRTLT